MSLNLEQAHLIRFATTAANADENLPLVFRKRYKTTREPFAVFSSRDREPPTMCFVGESPAQRMRCRLPRETHASSFRIAPSQQMKGKARSVTRCI